MNISKLKNIIKEAFVSLLEAELTQHVRLRAYERIEKENLLSAQEKSNALKNLDKIEKTNFPKNTYYGILLTPIKINENSPYYFKERNKGYYKVKNSYDSDYSIGDEIWAVVRNNAVITTMLRKSEVTKNPERNADTLDVHKIIKNIQGYSFQPTSKKKLKQLKKQRLQQNQMS